MTPEECAVLMTYANQIDPRVQLNDATLDTWWAALEHEGFEQAKWCIRDYYATANPNENRGMPTLLPAALRHRISAQKERAESQRRAITATTPTRSPSSFKERNPAEWERLVRQGRDQYRAELRSRGIEPHAETCADCNRPKRGPTSNPAA